MKEITIKCCEGCTTGASCIKYSCPVYQEAIDNVNSSWPHLSTGFGNAYGYPRHEDYLSEVRAILQDEKKGITNDGNNSLS